jgi:deoxyribodipyrimidine photolyase-related protein
MDKNKEKLKAFVIFPTHLFENTKNLEKASIIYLVEDPVFFYDKERIINFNKLKLLYHRATMLYYQDYLQMNKFKVKYINFVDVVDYKNIYKILHKDKIKKIYFYDPIDHLLEYRIKEECKHNNIEIKMLDNINYIENRDDLKNYVKDIGNKHYLQTSFYSWQRKRLNILMNNGKPLGGKLTYDTDNRMAYRDSSKMLPKIPISKSSKYIELAKKYVEEFFGSNYGNTKHLIFPINHYGAKKWFKYFLKTRFDKFGKYQDAFLIPDDKNIIMFHSGSSVMFNVGLITQSWIVKTIIKYANTNKISINNTEGLIRQLIGWNSFNRLYYYNISYSIDNNYFNFSNKMTISWWKGDLGIPPVDDAIKTAFKFGYLHHIQRLMIMLNFQILCEISYKDIYRWHMEYSCDAYDQFMIYNIYSMGYADGGKTTTKPYISSSKYILNMSNYEKGEWCNIWDALYYRFLHKNYELLKKNPRMGLMLSNYKKKDKKELDKYLKISEEFIKKIVYK